MLPNWPHGLPAPALLSLLPAWQWPTWLMFWTWLVVHIYSFIRYNYYGGAAWQSVILWILNKSVGEPRWTCG